MLDGLGIQALKGSRYLIPSWRHDLAIPADLVEEAARVFGYDKIRGEVPPSYSAGEYHKDELRKRNLRVSLSNTGFSEALSYSFIDHAAAQKVRGPEYLRTGEESPVIIRDPIIEGADVMRATLLPGLLDSIRLNFNQNARDLRLFP